MIRHLEEFAALRTALRARPSKFMHAAVLLLMLFLGSAALWSAVTSASLIVRAPGALTSRSEPTDVVSNVGSTVLGSSYGGRVIAVCVREGDVVDRGQVLARLDDGEITRSLEASEHALGIARGELDKLDRLEKLLDQERENAMAGHDADIARIENELRRARGFRESDLAIRQAILTNALERLARKKKLAGDGSVPESSVRQVELEVSTAQNELRKARAPVDSSPLAAAGRAKKVAEKEYNVRRLELDIKRGQRRAEIELASSRLAALRHQREQTVLRAPRAGVVIAAKAQPGDVVPEGMVLFRIADRGDFLFRAIASHEDTGRLKVGMPVRLKLDAYDHRRFGTVPGRVAFLSPNARVNGGSAGRSAGYEVRIEVNWDALDPRLSKRALRMGMTGRAEIVTGQKPLLHILFGLVQQSFTI